MSLESALKETTEAIYQLIAEIHRTSVFSADTLQQQNAKKTRFKIEKCNSLLWWKTSNEIKSDVAKDTRAVKAKTNANVDYGITQEDDQSLQQPDPPDIESLSIRIVATLAKLFGEGAKNLTAEQVKKALAYENGINCDRITEALCLALKNCRPVKNAPRAVTLDLCLVMLAHWSAMTTLDERRAFAVRYILTPYSQRAGVIPEINQSVATSKPKIPATDDTSSLFAQARTLIIKLSTAGYHHKTVNILNRFGAQKLGQVPQENLAEVVMLAEQTLAQEGETLGGHSTLLPSSAHR